MPFVGISGYNVDASQNSIRISIAHVRLSHEAFGNFAFNQSLCLNQYRLQTKQIRGAMQGYSKHSCVAGVNVRVESRHVKSRESKREFCTCERTRLDNYPTWLPGDTGAEFMSNLDNSCNKSRQVLHRAACKMQI